MSVRVVSLVPAAADWLAAFGVPGEQGPPALGVPDPDLVVVEEEGDVPVGAAPAGSRLLAFAPHTFKDVLDRALALGRAAGRLPEAMRALAEAEARLRRLHGRLGLTRSERAGAAWPSVAVLDAVAPPALAGRWVPDLVAHAGGRAVLVEAGEPPRRTSPEALAAADPDVLVVAPRGRTEAEARQDLQALARRPEWAAVRAVREGRAFAFEGDLLARPGPRLVEAAERLAAALHPSRA